MLNSKLRGVAGRRKDYLLKTEVGEKQVAKLTYCEHGGVEHVVDVNLGLSDFESEIPR